MKYFIIAITYLVLFTSCQNSQKDNQQTMDPEDKVTVQMFVSGMTCAGCEQTIIKSVSELEGTIEAQASLEKGTATIVFDKSKLSVDDISDAIAKKNYKVESFVMEESTN